jgi:methylthioribulose-1-phosphate dehydratase
LKVSDHTIHVKALCAACQRFGSRGWCSATSGNFSTRIDAAHCLITQSGRDKSRLGEQDLMICGLDGVAIDATCCPSAETPLHCLLYELDPTVGAVLHTHSVSATTLSIHGGDELRIRGYEMQKALTGITSHEEGIAVKIFANDQDMQALAGRVRDAWRAGALSLPGFLIAGHGLYAWGRTLDEAVRHIEGFEFLFECAWQERLAGLR